MGSTSLRERMQSILRARNYSPRTIETYIGAVARFARHFGRSPEQLTAEDITQYQIMLRDERHASWCLFNQTVCALKFLYREVLGRPEVVESIPFARREQRLPLVLSVDETVQLLSAVSIPRHRVLLTTIYSAGLRLGEALSLRGCDIDSARMVIRVRQGKGKKDRYVPLSPALLEMLREHWRREHLHDLLFPMTNDPSRPMPGATVERYLKKVARSAGLSKQVTPKTLRHSYATHLIEAGASPRVVQVLLGHASVRTTETYMHVAPQTMARATSPLDAIIASLAPR
jgi:site-specific recombinase XerD